MAQEVLSLFELCNVYFSSVIICIFQSHKRIICPSSLLNTNYECLKLKRPGRCFERSCMYDETCGISIVTERGAPNVVCASPHMAFDVDAPKNPTDLSESSKVRTRKTKINNEHRFSPTR